MIAEETLSADEKIEAIVRSPHILAWADSITINDPKISGGCPLQFNAYTLVLVHHMAKTVYGGKVRYTFTQLTTRQWRWLRRLVETVHPTRPELWLPAAPPRRHHYLYFRDTYLVTPESIDTGTRLVQVSGVELADERGLCQPGVGKSVVAPAEEDCVVADGKVISSASRFGPGEPIVDKKTGEILGYHRSDATTEYTEGGSDERVRGHRFVVASARGQGWYNRAILGVAASVSGSELDVLIPMLTEINKWLAPTAVIFDGAARGVHINEMLRSLGLVCIAPVAPKRTDKRGKKRVEHQVRVDTHEGLHLDGTKRLVEVWAERGAACEAFLNEEGKRVLEPLELRRLELRGTDTPFRLYGEYRTSDGFTFRLPLYQTEADAKRRFNRCEYLRAFPMDGEVYDRLYRRRPSAESVNRQIEDGCWQKRANVFGHDRVHVDLLAWALGDNAISAHVLRQQRAGPEARLAA